MTPRQGRESDRHLRQTPIFKLPFPDGSPATAAIFFRACLHVDVDGSKTAYGPHNSGTDYTANAGEANHWWALVCGPDGQPIVRDGFYVSTTSLQDPAYPADDRRRYVDAQSIPFIVLPSAHYKAWGVRMGDLAFVQKLDADDHTVLASSAAIFADAGPAVGEGSAELTRRLFLDPDPRHGGTDQPRIQFSVFAGSGTGRPMTADEIDARVQTLRQIPGLAAAVPA